MKATFKPFFVQDAERPAISETTGLACSIGQEMAERWPYMIGRIRIALSGGLAAPRARYTAGEAFMCGLSGLAERHPDARKLAAVLALNRRMMAIRLNGRTLVAFTPDRDIQFRPESDWLPASRVEAGAWSPSGQLLGVVKRILFSMAPSHVPSAIAGDPIPPAAAHAKALVYQENSIL